MKKNLFFLSFTLILAAFCYSIPVIDDFSAYRVSTILHAYDDSGYERVGFTIENTDNLTSIDNYEYYSKLNECALKYDLVLFVVSQNSSGSDYPELTAYVSSNEQFLSSHILLEKGYADGISNGDIYSTYSNERNHKILSFIPRVALSVKPIKQLDLKGIYINAICLKGNLVSNVKLFLNEIATEFGEIRVNSSYTSGKSSVVDQDLVALNSIYENAEAKFATCLILFVFFCTKIFSYTKKISIMKIEGEGLIKIYTELFAKRFFSYTLISFIIFSIFTYFIYGTNLVSVQTILYVVAAEFFQLIVISIIISVIIMLIIHYTPLVESINGQNNLQEVQVFAFFVKFISVFLILPLLAPTVEGVYNLVVMTSKYDAVIETLSNRYSFGTQGVSVEYESDIGEENYIRLRDELAENGNLFEQSKSFFMPENIDDFNPDKRDEYYAVDLQYLKKEKLLSGCNVKEICIFVNSEENVNKQDLISKVNAITRVKMNVNFIILNSELDAYSFSDILYEDKILNIPVIYIPKEEGLDGQLNGNVLIFDGTVDEAQKYVDSVFLKYGYSPYFKIESHQIAFQNYYSMYRSIYVTQTIKFVIMLLAYIYSNKLLIEVDIDNNRKRYWIAKVEGVQPYSFCVYLYKIVSPSVLALLGNILSKRIVFDVSFGILIIFILVIESIQYMLFSYKYVNVRRSI